MSVQEIHVGDYGTVFRFTCLDESGEVIPNLDIAVEKIVIFRLPDHSTLRKELVITNVVTGKAEYVTVEGDLSLDGTWTVQAIVVTASGRWFSNIRRFRVFENTEENQDS